MKKFVLVIALFGLCFSPAAAQSFAPISHDVRIPITNSDTVPVTAVVETGDEFVVLGTLVPGATAEYVVPGGSLSNGVEFEIHFVGGGTVQSRTFIVIEDIILPYIVIEDVVMYSIVIEDIVLYSIVIEDIVLSAIIVEDILLNSIVIEDVIM